MTYSNRKGSIGMSFGEGKEGNEQHSYEEETFLIREYLRGRELMTRND